VVIHGGNVPCVDVEVDGTDGRPETAHVDDVVVLTAGGQSAGEKSLTTVNNKPI
jgi:hypothetical protein